MASSFISRFHATPFLAVVSMTEVSFFCAEKSLPTLTKS